MLYIKHKPSPETEWCYEYDLTKEPGKKWAVSKNKSPFICTTRDQVPHLVQQEVLKKILFTALDKVLNES